MLEGSQELFPPSSVVLGLPFVVPHITVDHTRDSITPGKNVAKATRIVACMPGRRKQ